MNLEECEASVWKCVAGLTRKLNQYILNHIELLFSDHEKKSVTVTVFSV